MGCTLTFVCLRYWVGRRWFWHGRYDLDLPEMNFLETFMWCEKFRGEKLQTYGLDIATYHRCRNSSGKRTIQESNKLLP